MRAVLSSDAVTMRVPSGLKAADHTCSSCPRSPRHAQHTRCITLGEWSVVIESFTGRNASWADQFDFDLVRLDNDALHLPLDQLSVSFWRLRLRTAVLA